jgi:hypothetical protein
MISTNQSDERSVQDMDTISTPICNLPVITQQDSIEYIVVSGLMGGEAKKMACDEKVSINVCIRYAIFKYMIV